MIGVEARGSREGTLKNSPTRSFSGRHLTVGSSEENSAENLLKVGEVVVVVVPVVADYPNHEKPQTPGFVQRIAAAAAAEAAGGAAERQAVVAVVAAGFGSREPSSSQCPATAAEK